MSENSGSEWIVNLHSTHAVDNKDGITFLFEIKNYLRDDYIGHVDMSNSNVKTTFKSMLETWNDYGWFTTLTLICNIDTANALLDEFRALGWVG